MISEFNFDSADSSSSSPPIRGFNFRTHLSTGCALLVAFFSPMNDANQGADRSKGQLALNSDQPTFLSWGGWVAWSRKRCCTCDGLQVAAHVNGSKWRFRYICTSLVGGACVCLLTQHHGVRGLRHSPEHWFKHALLEPRVQESASYKLGW